mmetsp:Transcript_33131/g.70614  ORF Transcript_33131/g.70614 Transcript_33131/m.70614 type:complete len:235 (+) Transcript_33131:89-793(+)
MHRHVQRGQRRAGRHHRRPRARRGNVRALRRHPRRHLGPRRPRGVRLVPGIVGPQRRRERHGRLPLRDELDRTSQLRGPVRPERVRRRGLLGGARAAQGPARPGFEHARAPRLLRDELRFRFARYGGDHGGAQARGARAGEFGIRRARGLDGEQSAPHERVLRRTDRRRKRRRRLRNPHERRQLDHGPRRQRGRRVLHIRPLAVGTRDHRRKNVRHAQQRCRDSPGSLRRRIRQ